MKKLPVVAFCITLLLLALTSYLERNARKRAEETEAKRSSVLARSLSAVIQNLKSTGSILKDVSATASRQLGSQAASSSLTNQRNELARQIEQVEAQLKAADSGKSRLEAAHATPSPSVIAARQQLVDRKNELLQKSAEIDRQLAQLDNTLHAPSEVKAPSQITPKASDTAAPDETPQQGRDGPPPALLYWMKYTISLLGVCFGAFIVISKRFPTGQKHFGYSLITLIVGFWLKA
jgi:hypothetical protein